MAAQCVTQAVFGNSVRTAVPVKGKVRFWTGRVDDRFVACQTDVPGIYSAWGAR